MRGVEFIRQAFGTYLEPLYLSRVCDSCAFQTETVCLYRGKDAVAATPSNVRTFTVSVGQPVDLGVAKGDGDERVFVEKLVQESRQVFGGRQRVTNILAYGDPSKPSVIVSWLTKWHSDFARTIRLIEGAARVQQT